MASQKSLRSTLWKNIWFSPIFSLFIVFVIGVPLILAIGELIPVGKEHLNLPGLLWWSLFGSLAVGGLIGRDVFRRGLSFKCFCGQFYAENTPWDCGYCQQVNTPDHTKKLYNHLLRRCIKCNSIPLGLMCLSCNKIIA